MEFCKGGDLSEFIRKNNGSISEKATSYIISQISSALSFLSRRGIFHRDIKPQNILLTDTDSLKPTIKIGDFGFARRLEKGNLAATLCGSPLYMVNLYSF